jgi:hypothetical protein
MVQSPTMTSSIERIRKYFPQINRVVDATKTIQIRVLKRDNDSGRKNDPERCALAKACIREKIADGAIIGIGFSYLINGRTATRYKTSVAVGREITSFDRHHDFAEGSCYCLSKIPPSGRLDTRQKHSGPSGPKNQLRHIHRTADIRIVGS